MAEEYADLEVIEQLLPYLIGATPGSMHLRILLDSFAQQLAIYKSSTHDKIRFHLQESYEGSWQQKLDQFIEADYLEEFE